MNDDPTRVDHETCQLSDDEVSSYQRIVREETRDGASARISHQLVVYRHHGAIMTTFAETLWFPSLWKVSHVPDEPHPTASEGDHPH